MSWNSDINPDSPAYQFAACRSNRMQAVAGPGTGKSFALRRRITRLLEEGVPPSRILAVTFTRTAAADLRHEICSLSVQGADQVIACTLHSLCFSILSKEEIFSEIGRVPRPLLDHEIKPMLKALNPVYGNVHNKSRRIKAYEAGWARLQHEEPGYAIDTVDQDFQRELINWLIYHKAMLLGEIIPYTLNYLSDNPACRERNMFDHILVDEYQDLNKSEQRLIDILATNANLTVVGDDDQSIYSFKHAHPEGIREFAIQNSNCEVINFNECVRCPASLVEMASTLINQNSDRTLGPLVPREGNDAGNIHIIQWTNLNDEIAGIAKIVAIHLNIDPITPGDILILTPRRFIGYQIRNQLLSMDIKVRSYFREEALDTEDAKYIYSLFNLFAHPKDLVALRYLLGHGSNDFRDPAYNRLLKRSNELNCSIRELLDKMVTGEETIRNTTHILTRYKEIVDALEYMQVLIQDSADALINYLAPDENENLDGFREALKFAYEATGPLEPDTDSSDWLGRLFTETKDAISMPEVPERVDHVRIMSLHASKGLSAKFVVITGCVEGLIPRDFRDISDTEKQRQLEEERRLFYVAITRCKNHQGEYAGTLIISSCAQMSGVDALRMRLGAAPDQTRNNRASQFIRNLGPCKPRTVLGAEYLRQIRTLL